MKTMKDVIWTQLQTLIDHAKYVFGLLLVLMQEIKPILLTMIFLIVCNQITGVWKALKFGKWDWQKFKKLYAKLILYLLCIIIFFFYEEFILGTHKHWLTKGIASVIGFQEIASTYLNVSIITGKDFFSEYIKKLKDKL